MGNLSREGLGGGRHREQHAGQRDSNEPSLSSGAVTAHIRLHERPFAVTSDESSRRRGRRASYERIR